MIAAASHFQMLLRMAPMVGQNGRIRVVGEKRAV